MDACALAFLVASGLIILLLSGWRGLVRFGVSLPLLVVALERLASLRAV